MSKMVISKVTGASYGAEQWNGPDSSFGHSWHPGVKAEVAVRGDKGVSYEEWGFYVINSEGNRWYLKQGDWITSDWDNTLPTPKIPPYAGVTDHDFKKFYRDMTERDLLGDGVLDHVKRIRKRLDGSDELDKIDRTQIRTDLNLIEDCIRKMQRLPDGQ